MFRMTVWILPGALVIILGVSGWVYLNFGMMRYMDILVLTTSLSYQLIGIPNEILKNIRKKNEASVPYLLMSLGALSYLASTVRATIQPDWVDAVSRVWGAVGSVMVVCQIIYYRSFYSPRHTDGVCRQCEKKARWTGSQNWPRSCAFDCGGRLHLVRVRVQGCVNRLIAKCHTCDRKFIFFSYSMLPRTVGRVRHLFHWLALAPLGVTPATSAILVTPEEYYATLHMSNAEIDDKYAPHPEDKGFWSEMLGIRGLETPEDLCGVDDPILRKK